MKKMKLIINGKPMKFSEGLSVADLVAQLKFNSEHIAVAINETVTAREGWESRLLQPGEEIEIIHFVGGGQA